MEHPKDPYHVRPFPQQPHRGGKELVLAIVDLENALGEKIPDFERLRAIQEMIHEKANTFNDDKLVDQIRQISKKLDAYRESPNKEILQDILTHILQVRVELKHL